MPVTLQDTFLATGTVMFVLISVLILFLLLALVRLFVKIQTVLDHATQTLEDARRTSYSVQHGIFQLILKMIGGDR